MGKLKVMDLMTENVFSVNADEDLARLSDLMEDIHVRHMPVKDKEGRLVGLVSQRDLLRSALFTAKDLPLTEQRELLQRMTVGEIMTADPETAEMDDDIEEAGRVMLDNKLGCLPVVEGGKLVGILTEADFVKFVVEGGMD
ncbi:CBS domain-containing protein [Deltaproteobacteria bacterium PRO3]|nr:CBS domain-containing protein [Deltaproteobacteria bacterium PRO3]